MSKIQTKINFLEKKKTSARLQEKSKNNEFKLSCKSKTDLRDVEEKSYDKENELKVKLLCRKNPTVLIYRSPIKTAKAKSILDRPNSEVPEITASPSRRNLKSTKAIQEELNILESKEPSAVEQDLNISRSPLKEKKVGSETPTKQRRDYRLRKSPTKNRNTNSLYNNSKERNVKSTKAIQEELNILESNTIEQDLNLSRSPLKEKSVGPATPTKQRRDYCLRKSPTKNENINSIYNDSKENNESCMKKSPLKRGSPSKSGLKGTQHMSKCFKLAAAACVRASARHSSYCHNIAAEDSSPPKQKCIQEETPSQLLTKLALESPERKQDLKSRKELFPKGEFDEACKALHSSAPVKLPGREDKLEFIREFLVKHSEDQSSGALYMSGPPGTGKTASINLAISDPKIVDQYKVICLNCTAVTSCGSIYSRIVSELKLKVLGHSEKTALTAIEKHLESSKRKMILIVLDELDQLCSTKQSVLYSVFEWPARKNARLVLIGIANALDLTDRVLPRLQAHLALQPTVLHFPSYTRQQIIDIIADRLTQAGVEAVFSGPTLQLLAGKVAAVNGDVRRALDIARRVVEVAEKRTVLEPLSVNGSRKETVALQEVMAVINDVYSTSQSLDSCESSSFPLQQKLLICSVLLIRQTSKTKDVTVGKLHEVYKKVCERRNLFALDMSEFISLMPLVEARGILRVTGKTHNRQSKVVLQWDEGEVKNALQDKQLLAAVLSDKWIV